MKRGSKSCNIIGVLALKILDQHKKEGFAFWFACEASLSQHQLPLRIYEP